MKKFLSMVLALAMAMSLVTFAAPAAGAKDFTDNSSIQYKEAVHVISAIQIMDGYADASFNPSGTLTRGAAAKIICNMILGPTTASALPTNVAPFPDVAAGSTFAGYIAYCAEHSIISGYADGNFRPADSLSGYAFLKMLLCALGYDQGIEGYQGANWRVNVAKQALGIGLDDGLITELDGSRIVTREEAALYAFNTLQSDMVEYDNKTTVAVNGASVTVGSNKFTSRVASTQKTGVGNISNDPQNGVIGGPDIIQFAEEYFPRLERTPKKNEGFTGIGGDDFGRPTTKWTYKGVEVGKYPSNLKWTYNGEQKVSKIYSDLGLSGTAEKAEVWMNGIHVFNVDIERSKDVKLHELKMSDVFRDNGVNAIPRYTANACAAHTTAMGVHEITDPAAGKTTDKDGHALAQVVDSANVAVQVDSEGVKYASNPTAAAAATDEYVYTYNRNGLEYFKDKIEDAVIDVFYDEDSNSVVISAKTMYPGQIGSVNTASSTKNAYVTVDYLNGGDEWHDAQYSMSATAQYGKKDNTENEFETTEAFKEDDIVWFTFSAREQKIGEVHVMESVEGSLTRDTESAVTIDGKSYDYADEHKYDMGGEANDLRYNSSYVVYLANGKVLWMKESEFSAEYYALVERISAEDNPNLYTSYLDVDGSPVTGSETIGWNSARVRLLLSDGTIRTLDLDGSDRYVDSNNGYIKPEYQAGSIVRFVENKSSNTFRLYDVKASLQGRSLHDNNETNLNGNGADIYNGANYNTDPEFTITEKHEMFNLFPYDTTAGGPTMFYGGADNGTDDSSIKSIDRTGNEISADSSTIFVVKDKDTYKIYKGVRNAPTINDSASSAGVSQAYAYTDGGSKPKAKIVFVIQGTTVSSSKDITFLIGGSRSKRYTNSDTDEYFEYKAIVNGRVSTVLVNASEANGIDAGNPLMTNDVVAVGRGWYGDVDPYDGDKAWNSAVLNRTDFDDGLLISGEFTSNTQTVGRQIGIERNNSTDEVKLGTYGDGDYVISGGPLCGDVEANDQTYVIAKGCNIYYIDDDDNVTNISFNEIHKDKDDIVYYILNEDGDITDLFITEFEA